MNETTSAMTNAGYSTYETWNVSSYVLNDEFLFNTAVACVEFANPGESPWAKFVRCMMQGHIGQYLGSTPDGVAWDSPEVDTHEMESLMLMASLRGTF